MSESTQASVRAKRKAEKDAELARRKEQAEKAVKKTTGLLSGAVTAAQKHKRMLDRY